VNCSWVDGDEPRSSARLFRCSAAHRAFAPQTTAFGLVAQPQFEMMRERPPAAFGGSPPREGEIKYFPPREGEAAEAAGGRSHTISLIRVFLLLILLSTI
jgi:hypothetical protein